MERKVGEIFNVNGTILQVYEAKESDGCNGCFFEELRPLCLPYICAAQEREDGKDVQFKEISKTMTREEAKELLPIIQAFAEGKKIQYRNHSDEWIDIKENERLSFISHPSDYRIKSEPKYRPFKTQEECWNEMLKHQPFGWVKSKKSERHFSIGSVLWNNDFNDVFVTFAFDGMLGRSSKSVFEDFTFDDGTPFGIKEE